MTFFDFLVVGAGFSGSVAAEQLATRLNHSVLVVDRRPHVGGNAYDELDAAGIRVHRYGPHIFRTNSARIAAYLSRFTDWRSYEHRVLASVDGMLVPVPVNLNTINLIYGTALTSEQAAALLAKVRERRDAIRTAEDALVTTIGRRLYEVLFRGYTRKQWGRDPADLDASVVARLAPRTDRDDRYFTHRFQAIPSDGYTQLITRMLGHQNIEVRVGVDYRELSPAVRYRHLVYTGPIDEFFDHRFGPLPYRSLEFRFETLDVPQYQPVGTINYPNEHAYTRVTEFKHLTGQRHPKTTIAYEYPTAHGEPYYPVPCRASRQLLRRYEALAAARSDVTFLGRLGTYRYYSIDQCVAQALATSGRLVRSWSAVEPQGASRRGGARQ